MFPAARAAMRSRIGGGALYADAGSGRRYSSGPLNPALDGLKAYWRKVSACCSGQGKRMYFNKVSSLGRNPIIMGGGLTVVIYLATRNSDKKGKAEYMAMQMKVSEDEETAATMCLDDIEKRLDSLAASMDNFEEGLDCKIKDFSYKLNIQESRIDDLCRGYKLKYVRQEKFTVNMLAL